MRAAIIGICLTLCASNAALAVSDASPAGPASPAATAASPAPDPSIPYVPRASSWARTRPLSPGAISLLATGVERSSIVAGLLSDLERSDVVVYLTDSMPGVPGSAKSYLSFLAHEASQRYLLVRIDRWRLTPSEQIAFLAHELQHALEIAGAPEVRDVSAMVKLYRRIGWEGKTDQFETAAAQKITNRVRQQIAREDL